MTTPTPGRPRAARERDRVDRARNVARSVMASLPTGKDVRQGAGLARRPKAVDEAAKHLEKALYAAGDDWVEQTSRARHFQAALAALQRAQRESPTDPAVISLAGKVSRLAAWALTDQGGAVSGRRQEDRVDARLQAVVDGAQEVVDQARVRAAKHAHLDRYVSEGIKPKDAGGYEKLLVSNTHYSPLGPSAVPASERVPDEKAFRKEVTHWFTSKEAHKDPEAQKVNLERLRSTGGALYERVRQELAEAHWAKHGLHLGEAAAITTYTASDFTYMNPAMAGGAVAASWLKGVTAGQSPALFGGDKRKTAAENAQAKSDAVAAHDRKRAPADAALDAWRAQKGLPARPAPSAEERLERAQRTDLETARTEGAQHSAVAYRGLLKLPVWRGTLFRGDAMEAGRFDGLFEVVPTTKPGPDGAPGTTYAFRPKKPTHTWPHLVSMSRARSVAAGFGTDPGHKVLWQVSVIDGREVSRMSKLSTEVEVMVLPGTTVAIDSIELFPGAFSVSTPGANETPPDLTPYFRVVVKAHQVSPVQKPT